MTTSTNSVLSDAIAQETNGVLTYRGALAVLQDAAKSAMNATTYANLVAVAENLNVAGGVPTSAYVQQMFDNVVLGNTANASWNGGSNTAVALGDLSASSTQTQFDELIGKWFLGTDMPGDAPAPGQKNFYPTSDVSYNLPLFSAAGPNMSDVSQGQVGDCWFLAALGETALLDPSLIENMITSNGNGTFSIRFEVNGHADYVTVNNELPSYSRGIEQYDGSAMEFDSSQSNLWAQLIEKGLAQLAEQSGVVTGMSYAGGANQYYELTGGDGEGITLVTGQATDDYYLGDMSSSAMSQLLAKMQKALAAGDDVMVGTNSGETSLNSNLVDDHMFDVTAINASAGTVTLHNPWGNNSVGNGVAETFTIAASVLIEDQADFIEAYGKPSAPTASLASAQAMNFYNSGSSSVLFNNGGQLVDWNIVNGHYEGTALIGSYAAGFTEVGFGDFYGSGGSDVLLFNSSTGQLEDYTVQNGVQNGSHALASVGSGWNVVGTGDFYDSGTSDILLQKASSGDLVDYEMSDGAVVGEVYLGTAPGYSIVGIGDFDGNGASDILAEDGSGNVVDWEVRNGAIVNGVAVGNTGAGWSVVGTGDFYGTGTSDILLQNAPTGAVAMWRMSNGAATSGSYLGVASGYSVVGTGYYHGGAPGASSDILLQSASGAAIVDWQMQDGAAVDYQVLGTVAPGWRAS